MEKELKSRYDGMTIEVIEEAIEKERLVSRESQQKMIQMMTYLRTSMRFRENKRYAKETFWTYLEDRFQIREGTYREMEKAISKFPEEVKEYGVGLVSKVMRSCRLKAKTTLKEINKLRDEKPNVTRQAIERVIEKYRDPEIKKEYIDWRSLYEKEKCEHAITREALQELIVKEKEYLEQIEKLKATVRKMSEIRKAAKQFYEKTAVV